MAEKTDPLTQWLSAAEARCERASKGPWDLFDLGPAERAGNYRRTTDGAYRISASDTLLITLKACSDGFVQGKNKANAEFIAAARSDLPRALALLRKTMDVIGSARGEVDMGRDDYGILAKALAAFDAAVKDEGGG